MEKRLGTYWTTKIGRKKVVVFKSDSHLSQDVKTLPKGTGTLPNYDVWKQIISEVQPGLVLSTGTAGGIGPECEVGDVVVSPVIRYDCQSWLKKAPCHDAVYTEAAPIKTKYLDKAKELFQANADQLPKDNTRPPRIVQASDAGSSVVTTDFFGFDTSDNHYGLKDIGAVSEMGDAVLGQLAGDLPSPPRWLAVRNVSDPQIKAEGSLRDQAARQIVHQPQNGVPWRTIFTGRGKMSMEGLDRGFRRIACVSGLAPPRAVFPFPA